jgi:G3E family GTPase
MIILNKVSQAEQKNLTGIRKRLAALNQTAIFIETDYANVRSLHLYMLQSQLQDEFTKKLRKPFYSESGTSDFHSFTIRFGGLINELHFREWFKYFASLHKKDIFRIKGMVNFENNPMEIIVQSVGGITSVTEGSVTNPYEPLENVLVFIGKEISKYEIEKEIGQFLSEVS